MKVLVPVNRVSELVARQTTALLIASLCRAGHEVHVADVDGFSWQDETGGIRFFARTAALADSGLDPATLDSASVAIWAQGNPATGFHDIRPGDLVLIRTNPGRDASRMAVHDALLDFCVSARQAGVHVINDPGAVRYFASKSALAEVPIRFRPAMLVSHDPAVIGDFVVRADGDCVIKPLVGSRGQDVIRVNSQQPELVADIARRFAGRVMVAQQFVECDQPGDKRVVVAGGRILEWNRHLGGIHRHPAAGDFRANIHAGGTAFPLSLQQAERQAVQMAAKLLYENGIWLAGVDLIGSRIIEFNVFSTGGLFDANRFAGVDFTDLIVAELMNELVRRRS
jgi:glutathione synthase